MIPYPINLATALLILTASVSLFVYIAATWTWRRGQSPADDALARLQAQVEVHEAIRAIERELSRTRQARAYQITDISRRVRAKRERAPQFRTLNGLTHRQLELERAAR